MEELIGSWQNTESSNGFSYLCGHCGNNAGPSEKYYIKYLPEGSIYNKVGAEIFICPTCNFPTFFDEAGDMQIRGPKIGESIDFLPHNVEDLYEEARACVSVNANTSTVLSCRKLLMNIAVNKGAEEGKSFQHYVNYLKDKNYIPPGSEDWVDHIRRKGNEATHEIPSTSRDDAVELLDFTGMLLKFVYEMPGKMKKHMKKE